MISLNLVLIILYIFSSGILLFLFTEKNRWKALLITSLLFYYLLVGYTVILLIGLAYLIYRFSFKIEKKPNLIRLVTIILLLPLLLSKITNTDTHFENYNARNISITEWLNWITIFQVIGLSYFTFNGISYLVDIKRKYIQPEKNFFFVLLYLIYFPAIFSGPLHRAKYLFSQFKTIQVSNTSISCGMRLILWGLFKNIVLAQRIFNLMTFLLESDITGFYYLITGLLFFLYLYCNFSAFIDFFQGVSLLFGIQLKNNFKNRVYLSASRQEFWKGWHITLNEWFRDYFFFSIAKHDKKRRYTDLLLLITFLLIALWHELSTTLVLWGTLNGLWIIFEKKINFKKFPFPKLRKVVGVVYHLLFSCILALIFISPDVITLFETVFMSPSFFPLAILEKQITAIIIILLCFIIMDYHYDKAKDLRFDKYIGHKPLWIRWFIYIKIVVLILLFGLSGGIDNYYIQF